jgi:hypothetical protein
MKKRSEIRILVSVSKALPYPLVSQNYYSSWEIYPEGYESLVNSVMKELGFTEKQREESLSAKHLKDCSYFSMASSTGFVISVTVPVGFSLGYILSKENE